MYITLSVFSLLPAKQLPEKLMLNLVACRAPVQLGGLCGSKPSDRTHLGIRMI